MREKIRLLLVIAALLLSVAAGAGFAFDASFGGSYKSFSMGVYDLEPAYGEELYGTAENSLRVQARIYPSRTTLIETAYSIAPRIQSEALGATEGSSESGDYSGSVSDSDDSGAGAGAFGGAAAMTGAALAMGEYRAYDLDDRLYPRKDEDVHNLGLYQNLDRVYGGVYLPFGDLYLGRQAISWGNAHVINPTDILAPFSFTSLNTEHTRGVDAARLRMPLGAMGEVDLGYVAGDEFDYEKSAVFARGKTFLAGTDLSLLAMDFRENLMVGIDATGSIGGAGSWIEAAYVLPETFAVDGDSDSGGVSGPDTDLQYLTASVGMDYNFGEKLYGYAEYHFTSPGTSDPDDYAKIYRDLQLQPEERPAYSEGSVYLLGRHYVGLGGTYQITPLLPASGLLLVNATDLSANLSLSLEYNFTENVYLEGGAYLGLGEEPKSDELGATDYKSEFGAYPDLYYLSVKLYF